MSEIIDLVQDERTYIESVGRQDRETVREALADNGADTILRVCLGVTGETFPVRSLGYFASAIAVQEHYMPEAALQFVFPVRAAQAINGIEPVALTNVVDDIDDIAYQIYGGKYRTAMDKDLPDKDLTDAVTEVLDNDAKLSQKFKPTNKNGKSNYAAYVAAHVLMHDTNPRLSRLGFGFDWTDPFMLAPFNYQERSRVISIGAQSERPFYVARMACRRAELLPKDSLVQSGQIFTKHVLAPYMSCRQGEPLITLALPNLPSINELNHPVSSVQRDLNYLHEDLAERLRYDLL